MMIIIYTLLSCLFAIIATLSYSFSQETYKAYSLGRTDDKIRKEHRLYHLIFSILLSITSTLLSLLYIGCVIFSTILQQYIFVVPILIVIKYCVLVLFVSTCLLLVKHISNEESTSHRFYMRRKTDKIQKSNI